MPTKRNILLIGENCLDTYITCTCDRLCPEGPIPVAVPVSRSVNDGMAGNVLSNLLSLGWPETNITFLAPPKSITKTRYVEKSSGYMLLRVDEGEPISKKDALTEDKIKEIDWDNIALVIISDYNKGFLSESIIRSISLLANANRAPVICDTKKILGEWSKNIDIIKINWKEYQNQIAHGISRPTQYCKNLVVTRGAEGAWWVNKDIVEPAQVVEVQDVTGGGDTFCAAFSLDFLAHQSIISAMKYGNRAAAVAVSKRGVVAVRKEEVV